MQLKTVLNRCNKCKSFVYSDVRYKEENEEQVIEIDVKPRKNAKALCSNYHKPGPTYDTMREPRRFEFIPIWGILLFFYRMRRVDCSDCGVKVEEVPWGIGKNELTNTSMQYLAHWAKKQFSSGVVEGLNTKVKLTIRNSYGFRTFKAAEIALYHTLGKFPEPLLTHRFY